MCLFHASVSLIHDNNNLPARESKCIRLVATCSEGAWVLLISFFLQHWLVMVCDLAPPSWSVLPFILLQVQGLGGKGRQSFRWNIKGSYRERWRENSCTLCHCYHYLTFEIKVTVLFFNIQHIKGNLITLW